MNEKWLQQCTHPQCQRWQYVGMWMCCQCNSRFWGDKKDSPPTDIYGRTEAPYSTAIR